MNSFFPHYLLRLSLGRWEIHQGRVCDPEVLELINLFTDGSNLHCMIVAQTLNSTIVPHLKTIWPLSL